MGRAGAGAALYGVSDGGPLFKARRLPEVSFRSPYPDPTRALPCVRRDPRDDPPIFCSRHVVGYRGGGGEDWWRAHREPHEANRWTVDGARHGGTHGAASGEDACYRGGPSESNLAARGVFFAAWAGVDRCGVRSSRSPDSGSQSLGVGPRGQRDLFLPLFDPVFPCLPTQGSAFT